jgi:hypothetical protein
MAGTAIHFDNPILGAFERPLAPAKADQRLGARARALVRPSRSDEQKPAVYTYGDSRHVAVLNQEQHRVANVLSLA